MNLSLIFTILGPAPRPHLTAEEENHPNKEGAAHSQWRSQRCQIPEHAGLLSPPEFVLLLSYQALSPTPPTASNRGLPKRPWPHIRDLRP